MNKKNSYKVTVQERNVTTVLYYQASNKKEAREKAKRDMVGKQKITEIVREYPYCVYVEGDCISEHNSYERAEKAFNAIIKKYPDSEVDVLSADGETTCLSYDPETGEVYRDEHHL